MDEKAEKRQLMEVWDLCRAKLPQSIRDSVYCFDKTPGRVQKPTKNLDLTRIRIMPKDHMPVKFWGARFCFYQLGIGVDGSALNIGGVYFVQFPRQKQYGDGKFRVPVIDILRSLGKGRGKAFRLVESEPYDHDEETQASTVYSRMYGPPEFDHFPKNEAAKDLAWLIETTLARFAALV